MFVLVIIFFFLFLFSFSFFFFFFFFPERTKKKKKFKKKLALEVFHYVPILVPSLLFIVTYAGSNFFGVWTTQVLGATAR